MRRRNLFTLAAGASAVLCVCAVALWVRSYKNPDRFSGLRGGDRYTLVSAGGRLTLFGPPGAPSSASDPAGAASLVARLRNGDVRWWALLEYEFADGRRYPDYLSQPAAVDLFEGTPAIAVDSATSKPAVVRLLLGALERPNAFVAAHVLLTRAFEPPSAAYKFSGRRDLDWEFDQGAERPHSGRWAWGYFYGLRVRVGLSDEDNRNYSGAWPFPCTAWVDPTQLPAVRDHWHRRLDVQLGSMPYWPPAVVTAVGPVLWAVTGIRRWRISRWRLAANLCVACGFDLRATPNRCPECGTAAGGAGAAAEPGPAEPIAPRPAAR